MSAPALIDMRALMTRLSVKRKAALRLVALGKLRGLRVGRQWRFDPADVDAYLEREKQSATPVEQSGPLFSTHKPSRGASSWKGADRYLRSAS